MSTLDFHPKDYVVKFGAFRGKRLEDINIDAVIETIKRLKKIKTLGVDEREFLEYAQDYLVCVAPFRAMRKELL